MVMKIYIPHRHSHIIAQNKTTNPPIAIGPRRNIMYAVAIELNIIADIINTAKMASTIRACIAL